jgi:hypothetical protein
MKESSTFNVSRETIDHHLVKFGTMWLALVGMAP